MTDTTRITAPALRARVEDAYGSMAELAASMKDMAFIAGVLTACDVVAAMRDHAVDSKMTDLHLPTLQHVTVALSNRAAQAAEGAIIMDRIDEQEAPPHGVKPN